MLAWFENRISSARPAWCSRSHYRVSAPRLLLIGFTACCSLVLSVTLGCVSPSLQSDTVDIVQNPDLVKNCTLKSEGTYTALGEKNALTMAKNAAVKNGGNVILLVALDKSDTLTTAVNGKIYACARRP